MDALSSRQDAACQLRQHCDCRPLTGGQTEQGARRQPARNAAVAAPMATLPRSLGSVGIAILNTSLPGRDELQCTRHAVPAGRPTACHVTMDDATQISTYRLT